MTFEDLALSELRRLGIAHLNSRPYDSALSVFHDGTNIKRLVVVGFNGSLADKEWTNESAIEHGKRNRFFSNVEFGKEGGWLSKTLPKRLLEIPKMLGFKENATVYTNAILQCSSDASALRSEALGAGFENVDELVKRSLEFFENVTVKHSIPELIICYGNSLTTLSTSKIMYDRFGIGDITTVNNLNNNKTFFFLAKFGSKTIPVVCIRHLSRYKPCYDSIKASWYSANQRYQIRNDSKSLNMHTKNKRIERFYELVGRKPDSIYNSGKVHSFHLWKYENSTSFKYVDVIENKSGINIQAYFKKSDHKSKQKILKKVRKSTGIGEINNNEDYVSSKNCEDQTAFDFMSFILGKSFDESNN